MADLYTRLDRIEEKLDRTLERMAQEDQETEARLVSLESQAGFFKWTIGAIGATLLALAPSIIDMIHRK